MESGWLFHYPIITDFSASFYISSMSLLVGSRAFPAKMFSMSSCHWGLFHYLPCTMHSVWYCFFPLFVILSKPSKCFMWSIYSNILPIIIDSGLLEPTPGFSSTITTYSDWFLLVFHGSFLGDESLAGLAIKLLHVETPWKLCKCALIERLDI